jgi:hypothetical protein
MSRLLAVAARELRERWLLLPGALALGFVPLALPLAGVKRADAPVVGLFLAVVFGVIAAFIAGSSVLARDVASGRASFLFSRPLSWAAIWSGKWVAALVLVAGGGFLAAIPWMAAYPPETKASWLAAMADARGTVFFVSLLLLGIGSANFAAIAFRSRSPWLAVDVVLLLASVWAVRHWVFPLLALGVFDPGRGLSAYTGLLPLALALVAASAAQFAIGRTDGPRAHRALSLTFWSIVGVAILACGLLLAWVLAAGPAELAGWTAVTADPGARWAQLESARGRAGSRLPPLLLDTATGSYVPPDRGAAETPWRLTGIAFSDDGRRAARWEEDGERFLTVEMLDLETPTLAPRRVVLESSPPPTWATSVVLSPSGARVLVVHESGASLFSTEDGRRLATATIPPRTIAETALFLDEDQARVWFGPEPQLRRISTTAGVLTLGAGASSGASRFELARDDRPAGVSARTILLPVAGGRRLVSLEGGPRLRDGATGALLATLEGGRGPLQVLGLADGRVATVTLEGLETVLRIVDGDGRPQGAFVLATTLRVPTDLFEVPGGRVAVSAFVPSGQPDGSMGGTEIVDLSDGRVAQTLPGLSRARGWHPASDPRSGPLPAALFWDGEKRLVRVDFTTGEWKVVLGPGAPRGERISAR